MQSYRGIIPYIPGEGAEDDDKENPVAVDTFEASDDQELLEAFLRLEAENPRDKKRNKMKPKRPKEDPSQLSLDMDSKHTLRKASAGPE